MAAESFGITVVRYRLVVEGIVCIGGILARCLEEERGAHCMSV